MATRNKKIKYVWPRIRPSRLFVETSGSGWTVIETGPSWSLGLKEVVMVLVVMCQGGIGDVGCTT